MDRAAERAFTLERVMLARAGRGRRMEEALAPHFQLPCRADGTRVDSAGFSRLLDEYYSARGWDLEFGWPQEDLLESLGLEGAIPEIRRCRRRFADTKSSTRTPGGLPDGLDTLLGASGVRLSSGQGQLLALARALVGNPSLVLLDEATASVDSETERLIREGLARRRAGRTTLTVAHRLTSAQEADRVIVMTEGEIVEEGSPENLAAAGCWYAGMLELQRLGWTDVEG